MADGGTGMVNTPTLFLAGEAGPEEYSFSGAGKTLSGTGGPGGSNAEMLAQLRSLNMQLSTLPGTLGRALNVAWQQTAIV